MSRLHFAQISDTHIRKDYSSGLLHDMFDSLISPDEKLIQTLQELKKEQLDFIVITGDLVHEGNEADYQHFQNILNSAELAVPVLLALGNHDRKRAFCQVFHKELKNGRYFYFHQIREWKIIVLDSAGEKWCCRASLWYAGTADQPLASANCPHQPRVAADPFLVCGGRTLPAASDG